MFKKSVVFFIFFASFAQALPASPQESLPSDTALQQGQGRKTIAEDPQLERQNRKTIAEKPQVEEQGRKAIAEKPQLERQDRKTIAEKPQVGESFPPELISPRAQIKRGEAFLLFVRLRPAPEWHSYWSFAGDFGLPPKISFNEIPHVKIKPLPLPAPQRKAFELNGQPAYSFIYSQEFLIPFEVTVNKPHTAPTLHLLGQIEWSVCKEICISRKSPLKASFPIGSDFKTNPQGQSLFLAHKGRFPKDLNIASSFTSQDGKAVLSFSWKTPQENILCEDLFPQGEREFSSHSPALLAQSDKSCSFQVKKPLPSPAISGLLLYSQKGQKASALFRSLPKKTLGLIWFALLAFIGGLILNFMPCVLPIIFLKFYNTLELKQQSKGRALLLNLSYSAGVISSFLVLAFAIFASKQASFGLGWGFHLQSPGFVTCLALLFIFMACSMAGFAPAFSPKVSVFFKRKKLLSHFMTGVLSTTAASPCTVPFMAGAVGFALSRGFLEIFIIFFSLGLGLSCPYLLLSVFPQALRYVPAPGRWTEVLKQLLSIPLFLTALWLASLLYFQLNFNLFLLSALALLILFPVIFVYKKEAPKVFKWGVLALFAGSVLALLWIQKAHRGGLEPASSLNDPFIKAGLGWPAFDANLLLQDKQEGKNIFIALGAKWCLTCQFNERLFNEPEFKQLVKERNLQLYYGDWTNRDEAIGGFLQSMGRAGVPLYVFFQGEKKLFIFPELLFKESFLNELKSLSNPSADD